MTLPDEAKTVQVTCWRCGNLVTMAVDDPEPALCIMCREVLESGETGEVT